MITTGQNATTPKNATKRSSESGHWSTRWDEFEQLRARVYREGAQSLPGNTIRADNLYPKLRRALTEGVISTDQYSRMMSRLRFGAELFVDQEYLREHLPARSYFRNYLSAYENAASIHKSIVKRVRQQRTFKFGRFHRSEFADLPVDQAIIFPLGAVDKPHSSDKRAISDHTKSRLNEAARLHEHSLNALDELKRKLRRSRKMRMSDVSGAFTLLALVPWLWNYMFFVWFDVDKPLDTQRVANILYCHIFADFGTRGCPLEWFEFFTVVLDLARMESILTMDLVLYVDDLSHIGDEDQPLDQEGLELDNYLESEIGIPMEKSKVRDAAQVQLSLGLWWNTINFTLWLAEEKVVLYSAFLSEMASKRTVTRRELQQVAGREQRIVLTQAPGSKVLLANNYTLMSGLSLPHHRRRTTASWRADRRTIIACLAANAGRGYYAYDDFVEGGEAWMDASRNKRLSGGGYVVDTGAYHFWFFGSAVSRRPIDYLEGLTAVFCLEDNGASWYGKLVHFHIDNQAFQASAVKGWSHADRLNELLRLMLFLTVKYNCIVLYHWISTHDNMLADPLSRDDEQTFLVRATSPTSPLHGPPQRHADAGTRRGGPTFI